MLENARTLFRYNSRILLANSYWLLIIPLVASQVVIFWHMAIATLVTAATVAKTCELVIPLLAAFLCAHIVAPEHRSHVDEITFVRPVPFTRTIALRAVALYAIVVLLAIVMLYVYQKGLKVEFELGTVLLAGLPSMLFLSMLSLAFASSWRSPAVGIGAALLYWLADGWKGSVFNPFFSLYGYATSLANADQDTEPQMSWLVSKLVLLTVCAALVMITARGLRRPAAPKRWRAGLRLGAGVLVVAVAYLVSGAFWQFHQARLAAADDPRHARVVYQDAFADYGIIPVAYLFGADFASYVGYPDIAPKGVPDVFRLQQKGIDRLRVLLVKWPDSRWADSASYEIIKTTSVTDDADNVVPEKCAVLLGMCREFAQTHSTSPLAPFVAARVVSTARLAGDEETMLQAYDRIMKVHGGSEAAYEAAEQLKAYYIQLGDIPRAIEAARRSAEAAPAESKPEALLAFARFLAKQQRTQEARGIFGQVEAAVMEKLDALGLRVLTLENGTDENMRRRSEIMSLRNDARAGIAALDQPPPPQPEPHRRGRGRGGRGRSASEGPPTTQ